MCPSRKCSLFVIPVMLNSIHYRPTGGGGIYRMTGSLYPLFSTKKARDVNNEPVEAQFNSIGAAFQTDPSESDSEVGKRIRCFQKVAAV